MKSTASKSIIALGLVTSWLLPLAAAEPDADQILRQMSARIGAAHNFRFTARRELDAALTEGGVLPQSAQIEVSVLRPNKVMAISTAKGDVRRIVADGNHLSLLDKKSNFYTTVPMNTSLDGLVERVDEKYGFTPPLAEFILSDPYKSIRQQAEKTSYLGRATYPAGFLGLNGVECHRLHLSGKIADAELWVGVKDQLPRKLTATFKDRPGQPKLKVEFSTWNLSANAGPNDFTFSPPKGAKKIPMKTTAEMQPKH